VRQKAATFDLSTSPLADNQSMLMGAMREPYRPVRRALTIDLTRSF
jgi:hypothetical protein